MQATGKESTARIMEAGSGRELPPCNPEQPRPRLPTRVVLLRFFGFPLLVAGGCLFGFGLIWWMTHDARTTEDVLTLVHNAEGRERWQAAHELACRVAADPALRSDRQLGRRAVSLFSSVRESDPAVAGYLARMLARMPPEGVEAALVEALAAAPGRDARGAATLRIQVILALAEVGAAESTSALVPLLDDEDGGVRKAAAYAVGRLGGDRAVGLLVPLLRDRAVDVSWNAALGLATLGSDAGLDVLRGMLDRAGLKAASAQDRDRGGRGMNGREISDVVVNAVRAAARLERPELRAALEGLRDRDQSPRVQEAARLALARISGG